MTNSKEEWRWVVGFEDRYQVSNTGKIRGIRGKDLIPDMTNGYYKVTLVKDGKKYRRRLHRLVADAFIPNPHNLPLVCHNDGNRTNNHASNLRWDTPKGNMADKVKHGTLQRGETIKKAVLTEQQVRKIKHRLRMGDKPTRLARRYSVNHKTISDIKQGKTWKHVA